MNKDLERTKVAERLNSMLTSRSKPVAEAIAKLEQTGSMLDDFVKPVKELEFKHHMDGRVRMEFNYTSEASTIKHASLKLTDFTVGQVGDKFGVPQGYLRNLHNGGGWEKQLATTIMNEHASNIARERVLIRAVQDEARGFLSDKYRRLNSMEIFMAFLLAAQQHNNVLVDAYAGETKGYLEVINPEITEFETPLNGRHFAAFGARIRNSDFGDGALEVRTFMLNLVCMNGAVGLSMLKEFHLGGRIPENIRISEDTYKKDTAAKAGLVRDIMAQVYLPESTNAMIEKIQGASAKEVNLTKAIEKLPKVGFTLTESEAVGRVLMDNDPANGLQGSATLWKLVNGMTAVARDAEPARKRELETIASELLLKPNSLN